MASSKKPKSIEDDIAKKILKLLRKGTPAAKKKAQELAGIQNVYRADRAERAAGEAALSKEWGRKLGAEYYAAKRASESKSVTQRLRAESALSGMDSKFRKVGARQSANQDEAVKSAKLRADIKKSKKQAGGRNAPDRIDARKRVAANRAKKARPPKKK